MSVSAVASKNHRLFRNHYLFLLAILPLLVIGVAIIASAAQAAALADKQWSDLHARGALRVGIDPGWQPFSFYGQEGWQGLDADLTREIARRMDLQVQTDPVGYDSMYDALHLWQVDIVVSAVVVDPSKSADYAYSTAYFDAGMRVVSHPGDAIQSTNDLAGKRIAVALGSDADRTARYWARRLPKVTLVETDDNVKALAAVQGGGANAANAGAAIADGAIVDGVTASGIDNASHQWQITKITSQPYAIVVRRDNPKLLAAINQVLDQMKADGTLSAIIQRWTRAR